MNASWRIIRLSAKGTDRDVEMGELDKQLRNSLSMISLQQKPDKRFELVVAQSCVPELQEAVGLHHTQRQMDPRISDSEEMNCVWSTNGERERSLQRVFVSLSPSQSSLRTTLVLKRDGLDLSMLRFLSVCRGGEMRTRC